MRIHDVAFWFACFFLAGVLVASVTFNWASRIWPAVLFAALAAAIFLFLDKKIFAVLALFMIVGSVYYFLFDFYQKDEVLEFGKKLTVNGVVRDVEVGLSSQKIRIGEIQITAPRHPVFEYGDELRAKGVIEAVPEEWRSYFSKEDIFGLMGFPTIELVSKNKGSVVKAALLRINNSIRESFKKVLPLEKAAFLSGLTIGETGEFSKEFEEKLRMTGTAHLVALSGYNIAIIARVAALMFGAWLSRRWSFLATTLLIIGFVIMTGAEASVVRAALMAFVLMWADQIGRQYYLRNAITLTALLMVLINPKVLAFDIGFQLSFLAVIGIVYIRPYLKRLLKWDEGAGFLSWKENFLTTSSAQLAVLPIIIFNFGSFSPLSILSNILILEFIPITMVLGFFIVIAGAFFYPLSLLVSWAAQPFLAYILGVINLFGFIQGK